MNVDDLKWHHELDWRPWSYTDFADPIALMLNGIRGQHRRRNVSLLQHEQSQKLLHEADAMHEALTTTED